MQYGLYFVDVFTACVCVSDTISTEADACWNMPSLPNVLYDNLSFYDRFYTVVKVIFLSLQWHILIVELGFQLCHFNSDIGSYSPSPIDIEHRTKTIFCKNSFDALY